MRFGSMGGEYALTLTLVLLENCESITVWCGDEPLDILCFIPLIPLSVASNTMFTSITHDVGTDRRQARAGHRPFLVVGYL
jgi:hypothetical protein